MSGATDPNSFIKDEPEDLFAANGNHRFMHGMQSFAMPQPHQEQQYASSMGTGASVNPNELSMMGGSYNPSNFNNNVMLAPSSAHSYTRGISAINDDELLDSLDTFGNDLGHNPSAIQHGGFSNMGDYDFNNLDRTNFGLQQVQTGTAAMSINQQAAFPNGTPDGEPIQSPFLFQPQLHQHQRLGSSMPTSMSGTFPSSPLAHDAQHHGTPRARTTRPIIGSQRKSSNTRSPLTTHTPIHSLNGVDFSSRPIAAVTPTHQDSTNGQWSSTVGSYPGSHSHFSTPIHTGFHQHSMSDVIKTTSTPPKHNGGGPAMQAQEMKRRKRRESHNQVERRRRDNINDRIQELGGLAPLHRLEDDKVRKQLANNSPLSPALGSTSMSPQATSGLAGLGAKRASGSITQGLPVDDKDKGPNKGDILNGSVSWIRDLLWLTHTKMQQEEELADYIRSLGGKWPFEPTESEKRMRTELLDVFAKIDISDFGYSRAPGSGLRVPKHTDLKGDQLHSRVATEPSSLDPDVSNTTNTGMSIAGQYWSDSPVIMEDDEVNMEL